MRTVNRFLFFIFLCLSFHAVAEDPASWKFGYKEGGGGIWWASPDDNIKINILGYAQVMQKLYASQAYHSRPDAPLAFSVRRARFDFGATVFNDHTLFIEYDGAPATSSAAGRESGFGLVEAHTTHRLMDDRLSLRMGKFVVPFSTENFRSSRAFDVAERYMVLNTMFGFPALDTQYGAMLMGKLLANHSLSWYLSATNGNAKASANTTENNNTKEYTARLSYDFYNDPALREQFNVGMAFDLNNENAQTLTLSDLAGGAYNSVAVSGSRRGWEADAFYMRGPLSVRLEYMDVRWSDAAGSPSLSGGFLQTGYFIKGSERGGFQALLRGELARISGPLSTAGADQLTAAVAGWQWFLNANVRHQFNVVTTMPNGGSPGVYGNNEPLVALLSQMQIKF